jgi:hypothetical protein
MNKLSIIGLFCEDIREEVGEQFTLIGLMSDNVNVRSVQIDASGSGAASFSEVNKTLAKVCIFSRANFDPADPLDEIQLRLVLPDGQALELGGATPDDIKKAKSDAIAKGNPLAGIVMRAVVQGLMITGGGVIRLEAVMGSETRLLAFMNFAPAIVTSST